MRIAIQYPQNPSMRLSSLTTKHLIASMGIYQKPELLSKQAGSLNVGMSHIWGPPPFCVDLRFGQINEDVVSDLLNALDTLAQSWKKKEHISKLAAHAIISVQELLMIISSLFSGAEKQRLQDIEQAMTERIMTCLR